MSKRHKSFGRPRELSGAWSKDQDILIKGWQLQNRIDGMKDAVKTCDVNSMLVEAEGFGRDIGEIFHTIRGSSLTPAQRGFVRNQASEMHQEVFRLMHGSKGFATLCVCKRGNR